MNRSFKKLVTLLKELFQLDRPDLDFGFYRIMHAKSAVVTAVADFNRRRRMTELMKYAGTCTDLMTVEELQAQRRRE